MNALKQPIRYSLIFAVLLVAVLLFGCKNDSNSSSTETLANQFPPNLNMERTSFANGHSISKVQLYFDDNKIHLIQIETLDQEQLASELHGNAMASIVSNNGETLISPMRPDGTALHPSSGTVVTETIGDIWTENTITLTRNQWQRFKDYNPKTCTAKSLETFALANPEIDE